MNEDNVMMMDTDSDTATESDTGVDTTMDNSTSEIDTSSDTSDTNTLDSTSDTEDTTSETDTETGDDTASDTEDTTSETEDSTSDTEDTASGTEDTASETDTETGDTATDTDDSDTDTDGEDTTASDDSQMSEDTATEDTTLETDTETGDTATDTDSEMSMGGNEFSGDVDSSDFEVDGLLDLTDMNDTSVPIKFTVERDSVFDNTLGFYEIASDDGSVEDPLSGQVIAPGENGYQEAALANRLDLGLSTLDGQVDEITTEIDGGSLYASYLVVDGEVGDVTDEATDNDPQVFFSPRTANPDNFNYIRSIGDNQIGYEDILGGGDEDFNDLIVEYEFV